MIAAKDGLFRDHGLDVTVKTYNSLQPEVQALKNGSVDIAAGDYADFFYEDATGKASLHLVADGYDATLERDGGPQPARLGNHDSAKAGAQGGRHPRARS